MPIGCEKRSSMSFDVGLYERDSCMKLNNRWLFQIDGISAVAGALPPLKSARPHLQFKEQQISHLVQHIYYPVMGDWKPVTLTLYDNKVNENPVFEWVQEMYDPKPHGDKEWQPVADGNFKRNALLCLYDGCGEVIERWKYENAYPQSVNWGSLNMAESSFVTVDIRLRYDRAYLES